MAIRLVRHDISLVNPCCLFPITIFSFTCPEICFKRTHSMVLPMGSSESARPVVPQVDLLAFFWTQVQHLPCHWVPNPLKFYFFRHIFRVLQESIYFFIYCLGGKRRSEHHRYNCPIKGMTKISVNFPWSMQGKWSSLWEGSYGLPKALVSRKSHKREKKELVGRGESRL